MDLEKREEFSMAIYHCSIKVIGRNQGRSAVAAAAYRAGEKLINQYDGIEHDFTHKKWIEYTEIVLPDNAPRKYADRSILWNSVEKVERAKDARLAREFELALPRELTREQQIEVIHRFIEEKLTSKGLICDVAIHNPPVMNGKKQELDARGEVTRDKSKMQFINPHVHILTTIRMMDEQGHWQKKTEKEYCCKRGEEEKGFTAKEFQVAKNEGWCKQYRYMEGRKKVWLTLQEGKERGLEKISSEPKTTRFGRQSEEIEYLCNVDRIFEWREYWEKVVNEKFKEIGSEIRIDHRSYKDQGRENEIPTIHMGVAATNMEKRAIRELSEGKDEAHVVHSDIFNINKQIKEHNKFVREMKEKLDAMVTKAKDMLETVARKLETMRANIIGSQYEEIVLTHQYTQMSTEMGLEASRMEKYETELIRMENANKCSAEAIKSLQRELQDASIHQFAKKADLRKQIQREQEKIEDRREYQSNISRMCGFASDEDYEIVKKAYTRKCNDYKKLGKLIDAVKQNVQKTIAEYRQELDKVEPENVKEIDERRVLHRSETETAVKTRLQKTYQREFREMIYEKAISKADKIIGNDSTPKEYRAKKMKANGKNRQ